VYSAPVIQRYALARDISLAHCFLMANKVILLRI